MVAPFAGVWIEIRLIDVECGGRENVAPFAGVWIEIVRAWYIREDTIVAPFAGVWIEMMMLSKCGR